MKNLVSSNSGFSLSDVLEADFETLFEIMSSEYVEEEKLLTMEEFMRANPNL